MRLLEVYKWNREDGEINGDDMPEGTVGDGILLA